MCERLVSIPKSGVEVEREAGERAEDAG